MNNRTPRQVNVDNFRTITRQPGALLLALTLFIIAQPIHARTQPDYEREKRWAEQTIDAILVGEPIYIEQNNGHKFLGLYTEAEESKGAIIVAHGRGWSPDYELYGTLRTELAESGFSTLSIQMPVLPSTSKVGDYIPLFPDADERFELASQWLRVQGHDRVGIVSHSIGATMANHYLIYNPDHKIDAWVFISIINGLEDMFRITIPVLDIFGSLDWDITRHGGDERLKQIVKVPGSKQIIVEKGKHFFEGTETELLQGIEGFLNETLAMP